MESLLPFGIRDLTRTLAKSGQTLGEIDQTLQDHPGSHAVGRMEWTVSRGGRTDVERYSVGYEIRRDSEGLYLLLIYTFSQGEDKTDQRDKFYLVRRESNLLPGTYRYYFLDPYSEDGEGICSKIYFFRREFVTRPVLQSYGILYKQQRESHTGRDVWIPYHRIPDQYPKYIKTHYRGRETGRYRRYCEICDKGESRLQEYLCKKYAKYPEFGDLM